MMSKSRLWVRISNCSRLFLSTWGERLTVKRSILVGNGIGPRTCAPVRFAVFTISLVELSRIRWSKALSRIRMFWPCMVLSPTAKPLSPSRLLQNLDDDASADGSAAFADGEAQLLFHRDRHDQLDLDRHVVARHHHLGAFRQLHDPRHVRRPEIELRTIIAEERRVTPALFLRQDIGFRREVRVRRHAARLAQNLAALDRFLVRATQQTTDIVARLARIQELPEHLDTGDHRLRGRADAHDLDFL